MTLLLKNSLPAERNRGCCFAENFDSVEAFYKNGGTITGTPIFRPGYVTFNGASRIDYNIGNPSIHLNGPFTLIIKIVPVAVAALSVIVGFGKSDLTNGPYIGIDSLIGTDNIWIGNYGGALKGTFKFDGYPHQIAYTSAGAPPDAVTAVKLYVDGILKNSGTPFSININHPTVFMGDHLSGGYPYTGIINWVRLFSQELSIEEVAAYANNTMWSVI